MFFSVHTLGCKLNQLETEAIADSFSRKGLTQTFWNSDNSTIRILNTCTVTSMAEQKARRIIRKVLRDFPDSFLIITGCYVQMEKPALASIKKEGEGRVFLVSGDDKDSLLDLPDIIAEAVVRDGSEQGSFLSALLTRWADRGSESEVLSEGKIDGSFRFKPINFSSHVRAFLKIQDGCDNNCSYCRVSLARGKSRSLGTEEALSELIALEKRGYAEAVLTGVNISQYNDPKYGGLPGLLNALLEGTESIRLRLSSIEPEALTEDFYEVITNNRIRPHFHLSVQSGSRKILKEMGRDPFDIRKAAARLRNLRDAPFLACDIITGFPGETEEDFLETFKLCEEIGFSWIHAFPFSPRPGTAAAALPKKVSEREAGDRVGILTELARKGRSEYIARFRGKEVEVIVEESRQSALPGGSVQGISENYLKLLIKTEAGEAPKPGSLIRCKILHPGKGHIDAVAKHLTCLN
ncbi:MAG: tRNA (N(6)-L-threonylcarbamoyladenosine(37)-C(2))-methylthiotransferase MtaB [Treponema sp.]|nr:tRNA (N(6)-L-threonylcarbamoyladenosine(37)-C(2))-methylthiotransferase MtaB [Treponema sp.]